jgi:D-sedoheptulose 7-phosphate isomerase
MTYPGVVSELLHILEKFSPVAEGVFKESAAALFNCLREGHKIIVFGNGGSAAQAQHFAAELVNRFLKDRRPLAALSLTTDTSVLTSIGNDLSFARVFSRQILALGEAGDAAIGLSTSGTSANVLEGLRAARSRGMLTIAITGQGGGALKDEADFLIAVPSADVPRIQEVHLLVLHLLAQELENSILGDS